MRKKIIFDYIFVEFSFYMLLSTICGYGIYFLMSIGFSSFQAGIISAVGNIFSLFLQPFVTNVADKSKKFNAFTIAIILSLLTFISSLILFFQKSASLLVIALFICVCGYFQTTESLANTIPSLFDHKGLNLPFGLGRAFGSMSYALVTYGLGLLTVEYGIKAILLFQILSGILMSISFSLINRKYISLEEPDEKNDSEKETVITYSQFIKRHKMFIILNVAVVGIYFGYTISDNFMVLVAENVGGNESDAGTILGIKAVLEIPVIFFYEKIEKVFKAKRLLFFSVICLSIKSVLIFLSKSTIALIFTQLIQPLAIAIFIPSMVTYTNQIMQKQEATRGQSLSVMAFTLATIISSPIGGAIAENYSVNTMLLLGAIVSIISSIAFCITISKDNQK